jgi:hypothetical protein
LQTLVELCTFFQHRAFGVSPTFLKAEKDGKDWEAELKKLEKDAEERLNDKVAELKSNIGLTGSK